MPPPRKTHATYLAECVTAGLDLPVTPYITARTDITHRCNKCGELYEQRPANHLNGNGCPDCGGSKRKTYQKYRSECLAFRYDLPLDSADNPYVNAYTKLIHICTKEGHPYHQRPSDHLSGYGCSRCNKGVLKTDAEYREDCIKNNVSLPLDCDDNRYVNDEVKLRFPCGDHVYSQRPGAHLRGSSCLKCCGYARKTDDEYRQECEDKDIDLPIDTPDNRYRNNYSKLTHRCKKGHPYDQIPSNHIRGRGCPICRYKTASLLLEFLLDLGLEIVPEKAFHWAPTRRFDFYLPALNLIIELDGPHHFGNVGYSRMEHAQQLTIDTYEKMVPALNNRFHFMRVSQMDFLDHTEVMKRFLVEALAWHRKVEVGLSFVVYDKYLYHEHSELTEYYCSNPGAIPSVNNHSSFTTSCLE